MNASFLERPLRIIFLGTPDIVIPAAQLLALQSSICSIAAVVTQKPARRGRGSQSAEMPSPVHSWALNQGLPVYAPDSVGEAGFIEAIRNLNPDVCVTAAYGQYLPRRFLEIAPLGVLNIHPSLLPSYRGAAPVQRAIEAGETKTGVTVLFSTAKMDAGPIAAQAETVIPEGDTASTLLPKLFQLGAELLLGVLKTYQTGGRGALDLREQDETRVSFAHKISASESIVDPKQLDARTIVNKLRAFDPWPGVKMVFKIKDQPIEVRILAAQALAPDHGPLQRAQRAGVAEFDKDSLYILCKDCQSVLRITELQLPSKRPMLASVARNGWPGGMPELFLTP